MKTVRLLLPAEEEMLEAAFYYERQSQGLGQDFLRKVQDAINEIALHPTRWPCLLDRQNTLTRPRPKHACRVYCSCRCEPSEALSWGLRHDTPNSR